MAYTIEQLREMGVQMAGGTPQSKAIGMTFVSIGDNKAAMKVPWREDLVGDPATGVIFGGVITTLLDQTCGLAVRSTVEIPQPIATLDLRIDYMRPALVGRDVIGEAHCYHVTKSIAFLRAVAYEDDPADPIATAQGAFVLSGAPK